MRTPSSLTQLAAASHEHETVLPPTVRLHTRTHPRFVRPGAICAVALSLISASAALVAQQQPTSISVGQHKFFRHLLRTVGSPDYDPGYIADFEKATTGRFQLSSQDAAAIHAAGLFRTAVLNTRESMASIRQSDTALTPLDGAAIDSLLLQQEQAIDTITQQMLQSLSPGAATRLLSAASVVFVPGKKGN
jgi:hypothetical protein